jgi:hypothetical protein
VRGAVALSSFCSFYWFIADAGRHIGQVMLNGPTFAPEAHLDVHGLGYVPLFPSDDVIT